LVFSLREENRFHIFEKKGVKENIWTHEAGNEKKLVKMAY
jgi:hypothetical protein